MVLNISSFVVCLYYKKKKKTPRGVQSIYQPIFFQYEITVSEEKLKQMKPNMAAIAEYRKKVKLYDLVLYLSTCVCSFTFHHFK